VQTTIKKRGIKIIKKIVSKDFLILLFIFLNIYLILIQHGIQQKLYSAVYSSSQTEKKEVKHPQN